MRVGLCGVLLLAASCGDASPFEVRLLVHNRTAAVYEGSGGALGTGLEIRVPGVEGGNPLVLERGCDRDCGQVSFVDKGACDTPARSVQPGTDVWLIWPGRYYPRSADPWGPCLGDPRAVAADAEVTFTLCGRLRAENTRMAELRCGSQVFELLSTRNELDLDVPGAETMPGR